MAQNHIDTHPGMVKVDFQQGDFASRLIAAKVSDVACFRLTFRTLKKVNWLPRSKAQRLGLRLTLPFRSAKTNISRFDLIWDVLNDSSIRICFTWITLVRRLLSSTSQNGRFVQRCLSWKAPLSHSSIRARNGIWRSHSNAPAELNSAWELSMEQKIFRVMFWGNMYWINISSNFCMTRKKVIGVM